MAECRSCGAEIYWAITNNGKRMPVDYLPTPEGTIAIEYPKGPLLAIVLHGDELLAAREAGEPLHLSHFATCPNAASHRK